MLAFNSWQESENASFLKMSNSSLKRDPMPSSAPAGFGETIGFILRKLDQAKEKHVNIQYVKSTTCSGVAALESILGNMWRQHKLQA